LTAGADGASVRDMTSEREFSPGRLGVQEGGACPAKPRARRFAVIATAALLTGCSAFSGDPTITGSGQLVTTPFNLTGFTKVSAGSAFQVEVKQGPSHRVSVTVDDNLVEYLDVAKSGNTLQIRLKPNTQIRQATLKAAVILPELTGLDLSGATRTTVAGFESGKPLGIELSGASRLDGDITCGEAQFDVSGASRLELRGRAGTMKIDSSGASNLDLERFDAEGATVSASGASHVNVSVHGNLEVDASGASSVRYAGEVVGVNVQTSGASSVRRK
jgi:hypothetical protein